MKSQQSGFTLIELIAVIVILGILAATALPKYVDMSRAAELAAIEGVAGNANSAMALNYANSVAYSAGLTGVASAVTVSNCTDVTSVLVGGMPSKYKVTSSVIAPTTVGTPATCTITYDRDGDGTIQATETLTATFQAIKT